jgi:uncharacterized membrane protein
MVLSLSVVVLLGAFVVVLCRYAGLRSWHAAVAALFGFFVASTSAAPYVRDSVAAIARFLAGIDL